MRRSLISAPAACPVLHPGVSELLQLAEADALFLCVGRDAGMHSGEKTSGEFDAIAVPVYQGVQTVATVLLPAGVVSAETRSRAGRQVEGCSKVLKVNGVREINTGPVVSPLSCTSEVRTVPCVRGMKK